MFLIFSDSLKKISAMLDSWSTRLRAVSGWAWVLVRGAGKLRSAGSLTLALFPCRLLLAVALACCSPPMAILGPTAQGSLGTTAWPHGDGGEASLGAGRQAVMPPCTQAWTCKARACGLQRASPAPPGHGAGSHRHACSWHGVHGECVCSIEASGRSQGRCDIVTNSLVSCAGLPANSEPLPLPPLALGSCISAHVPPPSLPPQ